MKTRPKYTAVSDFSCSGHHYAAGDPVEHPLVLDAVLPHGDRFVTTNTKRSTTESPTTSAAAESPKEK